MKKIFKYIDKPLLIITVALFIFGLIMVFSASNVTAYMTHAVSPYNYFIKQGLFLLMGVVISLIIVRFNSRSYGFFSWVLLIIFTISLGVLLIVGKAQNQAVSWFDFGFFSIQPSEFIKIIVIVFLATYYDKNKKKLNKWSTSLFPIGICLIIAGLIFFQPDLGTTMIICITSFAMFLMAGEDKTHTFGSIAIVLLFLPIAVLAGILEPYRFERIKTFLNLILTGEVADPKGSGYQMQQILIGIGSGGFLG